MRSSWYSAWMWLDTSTEYIGHTKGKWHSMGVPLIKHAASAVPKKRIFTNLVIFLGIHLHFYLKCVQL